LTTVPRRERERNPERGSVSSQRSATWNHAPPRVSGFLATLTTDQPPVDFVAYEVRVNVPMGPRFTSETDRSREFARSVPGVR